MEALGPTQPPIQCVPGALSLEAKRPKHGADHSPPSRAEIENAWSCTSAHPIRLYSVVLSRNKSTGTTLLLLYLYLSERVRRCEMDSDEERPGLQWVA